jgi:outer membrane protein assembly factor BamA
MLVGTLEYRWPLWVARNPGSMGLDSYLFTDLGQVFGNAEEISLDHLTESYGFGIRVVREDRFMARLEFAWSDEEFVLRFRADQIFQFSKGGLSHGRNPVPQR